ncbi:MAG: PLP-dependent transferase [Caulobacteraceae bacterium]
MDISNNLGDAKSMATHPWTTTHRSTPEEERLAIGLTDGCLRLSVGLEGRQRPGARRAASAGQGVTMVRRPERMPRARARLHL